MILELIGVLKDATKPAGTIPQLVPYRQDIAWPRGEDGTIKVTVYKQDRTLLDLTGGTLVLGIRRYSSDATPKVSRGATITLPATGVGTFAIASADTAALIEKAAYRFDIQFRDSGSKRWQVVPSSEFKIDPIASFPGDAVT